MSNFDIEELVNAEWREGVSPGAAARQMCRSLRDTAPRLKALLEELLDDRNRASTDRSFIIDRFKQVAPEAGLACELESFRRINNLPEPAQ